jgi:hypothetical protein
MWASSEPGSPTSAFARWGGEGRPPSSLHRKHLNCSGAQLYRALRSRETQHFASVFAVVFAAHLHLLFFVVNLHLLFSCHPSPQAEDLLLAFAVVVAGRIGIQYALPFQPQTMRLKYNHSKAICRPG